MSPSAASRRAVLVTGATGVAATTLSADPARGSTAAVPDKVAFRHGVASGDPLPTAVVLWTRLTPTRDATPGSGRGPRVDGRWQVSTDRAFTRIARSGGFTTSAARDHTVKVDVTGLQPDRWYFYRFVAAGVSSPVGRTRTAPDPSSAPDHLRLGVVSCANLQAGYFSAYRALAARTDLHAVLHLGDYLYEYGPGEYGYGADNVDIRPHVPAHEMVSLADYRARHGQYKLDRDLQALHRRYPWIITWDDHEVANDAYVSGAENHDPATEGAYRSRRLAAHRAYDEWMPVRMNGTATVGDGTRLYRRFQFGTLAEISMLDLRTYRSKQVMTTAPAPVPAIEAEVSDPSRTITGDPQLAWLKGSLSRRTAQWKVIGNPVMIAPVNFGAVPQPALAPVNDVTGLLPDDGFPYNVDQWDGYTADRREVFDHIRDQDINDAVFITGDIHSAWAAELPHDASTYPVGDSAGVEFVCSSVTSNNLKDLLDAPPRTASVAVEQAIIANNRHIKHLNFDDHGFSVLDLTSQRAQMDWYNITDRADRDTAITYSVSFATASGTGRITPVSGPVGGAR